MSNSVLPSMKQTYHALDDMLPDSSDDDQKQPWGVEGKAVGSIDGSFLDSSTMVCNSFTVGRRQPVPARLRPEQ
jgi:hypothetical protein